jgi:hypothetical protein
VINADLPPVEGETVELYSYRVAVIRDEIRREMKQQFAEDDSHQQFIDELPIDDIIRYHNARQEMNSYSLKIQLNYRSH